MAEPVLGIDVGTTSCSVSMIVDGTPRVLPVFDGKFEMPTYLAFTPEGECLIGAAARQQSIFNPANTVFTIKRLIGRKSGAPGVADDLGLLPYKVASAGNGTLWVEIGGRTYTPTEITALLLGEVKRKTEAFLGRTATRIVMTVPATFDLGQIRATRDAAELAGFDVLRTIAEPTAASLAHLFRDPSVTGRVAIYDLGGGTFDISILELGDGVCEVKATRGDNRLGGEDFDHRLVRHFIDLIRAEHDVDLSRDALSLHRLKEASERLKIALDANNQAIERLPMMSAPDGRMFDVTLNLDRATADALFAPLIARTLKPCADAMAQAVSPEHPLSRLVLVGGMSRTPAVVRSVRQFFGIEPEIAYDPTEVVACGAAVQAGVLSGQVKDTLLLDTTAWPIGLTTPSLGYREMIPRDTTIPALSWVWLNSPAAGEKTGRGFHIHLNEAEAITIVEHMGFDEPHIVLATLAASTVAELLQRHGGLTLMVDVDANHRRCLRVRAPSTEQDLIRIPCDPLAPTGAAQAVSRAVSVETLRQRADSLLALARATLSSRGPVLRIESRAHLEAQIRDLERAIQSRDASELLRLVGADAPAPTSSAPLVAPALASHPAPGGLPSVFISYARADRKWLDRLLVHLKPLERQKRLAIWHDGLTEGRSWETEVQQALRSAQAAILLVSADFIASEFVYTNELPTILDRWRRQGLAVLPLVVGSCAYDLAGSLREVGAFNDPRLPLGAMPEADAEAALARLAQRVWAQFEESPNHA